MRSIETERLISFHDQKLWIDSNWCLKIERIPNGFVSIESNSKVVCTKTNNSIWSANGKLSTASSENNIQQQQKEEKSKLYNTTAIKPRKNHGNNTKASEYNNSRAVFVEGNLFCFSARTHFVCMPPVWVENGGKFGIRHRPRKNARNAGNDQGFLIRPNLQCFAMRFLTPPSERAPHLHGRDRLYLEF